MTTPAAAGQNGAAAGGNTLGGRSGGIKGFLSGLFGGGKSSSGAATANRIPFGNNLIVCQDTLSNGRYFAEGNHHEAFMDYWLNHTQYDKRPSDINELVYIKARDIQGIYLNESEVQDPDAFWRDFGNDHSKTQESFVAIAKQIPAVMTLLDSGKNVNDIRLEHPELAGCVAIYFDDAPVIDSTDGFYIFGSGGRHRSLAAQTINGVIPVRIRNIYTRRRG